MPVVCRGEREKTCLYFCVQGWFVCVRSSVTLTEKPFVSCNQVAIFTRSGSVSLASHLWQAGRTSAAFADLRVLLADCVFGTRSFLIRGQKKPLSNGPTCAFLYIYKPCTWLSTVAFECCCMSQLVVTKSSLEVASLCCTFGDTTTPSPCRLQLRTGSSSSTVGRETFTGRLTHNHELHVTTSESFFLGTYHHVVVFLFRRLRTVATNP